MIITDFLISINFSAFWARTLASVLAIITTIVAGVVCCVLISKFVHKSILDKHEKIRKTHLSTDFLRNALRLTFFWTLLSWVPETLIWSRYLYIALFRILAIATTITAAMTLSSAMSWLITTDKVRSTAKNISSKMMLQVAKILIWSSACITVVSLLMGKSPIYILSGLGALTAVLMLVFKDSITGLVAGIQVAQNDMVRVGDWITLPKHNADGTVIDIALTTVKVKNFDNTVTMIPSSVLISDSFINWRYMSDSKGRRIKRPVWISVTSIQEMTPEIKNDLVEKGLIDESDNPISNLSAFELWLRKMLLNNPNITKELVTMVRQTPPSDTGIPVEIYAFTKTRDWVEYENIQSEIFDLIYITAPKFSLQIYQRRGDTPQISVV